MAHGRTASGEQHGAVSTMTLLHPFRHRRHDVDELAELRPQMVARAKKVKTVRELAVLIDDVIDALDYRRLVAVAPGDTGPCSATGPVRDQEWSSSGWSCRDHGEGLSVADAKKVTRQHLRCPGDDPQICRIKYAAMQVLIREGVLVPAAQRTIAATPV